MKKSVIALALVGIMPMLAANAAAPRSSSSASVGKGNTYKTMSTNRKTGGYKNTITNNFYYNSQPGSSRYASSYSKADANGGKKPATRKTVKTKKTTTTSQERKFFLAHPFFQPLQGKFGSVTDISYAKADMNMTLLDANIKDLDTTSPTYENVAKGFTLALSGKETTTQFAVKEDISYGLSDTVAIMLMAQYDKTEMEVKDWSDPTQAGTKTSTSGVNVFGLGVQARVADTSDYIAMLSAYFQHQKDAANTIMGELKVGTKVNRYTVYGLARASYSMLENKGAYGAYLKEDNGDWLMLSYKTDTDSVFQGEVGAGIFGVFNKYMTAKAEMVYGLYDWHNQLNIRGEIGFQPGDTFAVNLYASTALHDSAKGKVKQYMNYDLNPASIPDTSSLPAEQQLDPSTRVVYTTGDYKINKYNEWKIGVQGILYF